MKIAIIGAGNIGLITALCLSEKNHDVYCVDISQSKIGQLSQGKATLYEPGLEELLKAQLAAKKIHFLTSLNDVPPCEAVFIAVGTPNKPDGTIDLGAVELAAWQVAESGRHHHLIIRSTVPPGTNERLAEKHQNMKIISCPEFLSEGTALGDCRRPGRILVGSKEAESLTLVRKIFAGFDLPHDSFMLMDPASAEMAKYAANIFLAARVSLINEFSRVCSRNGADIKQVQRAISCDPRIGPHFLNAGLGYGGSCFPKDIDAFLGYAETQNEELHMVRAVKEANRIQIESFAEKIMTYCGRNKKSRLCLWGLSFKPGTDDLREAPALQLIERLKAKDIELHLYDPQAGRNFENLHGKAPGIRIFSDAYEALKGAEALVISTEWDEFISCDVVKVKAMLAHPVIFDGRNIFDPARMKKAGFEYHSIGRPS